MTKKRIEMYRTVQDAIEWLDELIYVHNLNEKLNRDAVWVVSKNMVASHHTDFLLDPPTYGEWCMMGRQVFVVDTAEDYFFAPAFDFGDTLPYLAEPLPEHFILYCGELYKYKHSGAGESAYYCSENKQVYVPKARSIFEGTETDTNLPSQNDTRELDEFINSFALKPAT